MSRSRESPAGEEVIARSAEPGVRPAASEVGEARKPPRAVVRGAWGWPAAGRPSRSPVLVLRPAPAREPASMKARMARRQALQREPRQWVAPASPEEPDPGGAFGVPAAVRPWRIASGRPRLA